MVSVARLFLFLALWLVGADPEISSPRYFCKSPFQFLLIDLDPENVTLVTLVNFPTVNVWLDLRNITLATLVMFLSVRK